MKFEKKCKEIFHIYDDLFRFNLLRIKIEKILG